MLYCVRLRFNACFWRPFPPVSFKTHPRWLSGACLLACPHRQSGVLLQRLGRAEGHLVRTTVLVCFTLNFFPCRLFVSAAPLAGACRRSSEPEQSRSCLRAPPLVWAGLQHEKASANTVPRWYTDDVHFLFLCACQVLARERAAAVNSTTSTSTWPVFASSWVYRPLLLSWTTRYT